MTAVRAPGVPLPDRVLVRRLWPLLLAAAVGLLPFTVFGTYLVAIAARGEWDVAGVGSLRGLGGLAALVVGVAAAPWLDRVSRSHAAAVSLVLLGAASLLGTAPSLVAVAGFCVLVGAATSVLNPAVAALASDSFDDDANAARAATLVSAVTSLTAMLAAPVIAAPSLLWGWQGTLVAIGVIALGTALLLRRWPASSAPVGSSSWWQGLRGGLARRGVGAVLGVSLLRTTAFMGWLAYAAALYDDRFDLGPEAFALVWTLSGAAFFLGNLYAGRHVARLASARTIARATAGFLVAGVLALVALVAGPVLPVALLGTVVLAASHAAVAAGVTTLLVRGSEGARGTVLGLNAAGQSLGVFSGAALGGLGLALGGWAGIGWALGLATALAVVLVLPAALRGEVAR